MITRIRTTAGFYFSVFLFCVMAFWSCTKNETPAIDPQTTNLAYVLAHGTSTTIFNSAVIKAGLDSVFDGPSIFTLLVPTDQACTNSGFTQSVIDGFTGEQARAWVLYQTYAGTALNFESFIGKKEMKLVMADGDSVFISGDTNRTYVNGFEFINSEIATTNGNMLALQNVLVPVKQNILQLMAGDTSLSYFYQAIQLSSPVPDSLSVLFTTGGPFSIYAPNDDAFRNLGYTSPSDLSLMNPDSLRSLVLLSVIPQRLFSYDIGDSSTLVTYNDSTLEFYQTGLLTRVQLIGSDTTSNVVSSNHMATNGVLFKIAGLLAH